MDSHPTSSEPPWRDHNDNRQRGVIVPLVAVALLGIFAMAGYVIDSGLAFKHRMESWIAADAAALAGAHELFRGNSSSDAVAAAYAAAKANGYEHGVDDVAVTIHHPPVSGFYVGNDMSVEVTITRPTATSFLRVLNINEIDVATRAVANGDLAKSINCIYVLDPDHEGAFEVTSDSLLGQLRYPDQFEG